MSYRVPLALFVVLLAILGALLHPLALVLALFPFDTAPLVSTLVSIRETIADLLGWGVLTLLVVMVVYVVRGRMSRRRPRPNLEEVSRAPFHPSAVVAITAYNDAEATAQAVKDFRRQPVVVKVLVIDNNSTDGTATLATAVGATVIQETRQGYGYACMRGLAEGLKVAEANVIVLTEGDGTFIAEDIAKFLAYIVNADLVVGNRVVRGLIDTDSQMDHFFTWGNMAVAMLLRLRFWDGRHLGPAGLMDVGCTFRAIRRPALELILPDLLVGGNHFSPHMLLVAISRGLSVIEIPIRLQRRVGESKGASQSFWKGLGVGLAMIWHIIAFRVPTAGDRPAGGLGGNASSESLPQGNGQAHSETPSAAARTR
ncbi:MAG TPA: glycosyltransferase family 2 protein [Candidatus Acidoferrum sp.]|nr:glycosyltransferase family 2 protein [Candidatus Acidoferrum sp.]